MKDNEYHRRQSAAKQRLRNIGEHQHAMTWLHRHALPPVWKGTPLEYAEQAMPVGLAGKFARWIGRF